MKTLLLYFVLISIFTCSINAQYKNQQLNIKKSAITQTQFTKGINIRNIENLTTDDLAKLKIPKVVITKEQLAARSQKHWELSPLLPKSGNLNIGSYYGFFNSEYWKLISRPVMGYNGPKHNPAWLYLDFKPMAGKEYRMKIFLKDYRNGPGVSLYVKTGDLTGQYPIDSNDMVSVVWTIDPSAACPNCISIGQIALPSYANEGLFPDTSIGKIFIDEL